jgi:hypothetical protein
MSDYSNSVSEEYLSEHESDENFVEKDDIPINDDSYKPNSSQSSDDSEDLTESVETETSDSQEVCDF